MASIFSTVRRINRSFDPDPTASITVKGKFVKRDYWGRAIGGRHDLEFEIVDLCDGQGPAVWPGLWFQPGYGIWFNPWCNPVDLKIREAE